jgi:antitoxin FitA
VRTLYIRNVPDEVAETLERLAKEEGVSLNAFVLEELTHRARRAKNAEVFARLPKLDVPREAIRRAVQEAKDERDRS